MHSLPDLPYKFDALEPHIDAKTMEIHHGKHHQAYVDNLNKALESHPDLQDKSLEDLLKNLSSLPGEIRTAIQNNGGGHYNHSLFWTIMSPEGGEHPGGELKQAMMDAFGDFEGFKTQFTQTAMTRFGSGWAWMYLDRDKLAITSTPNQDSPLMEGHTPILGLDVWEHAYYLHYQNRRADYVDAWFNLINWPQVETNFAQAK